MEDFVTFELAKKLKEKGFNEPCIASYCGGKFAPHKVEILGESEYIDEDISISYESLLRNDRESSGIIAPTISQVLKWLRKKKGIFVEISPAYIDITFYASVYKREDGRHLRYNISELKYNSYEKAALAGIEYVLYNLI